MTAPVLPPPSMKERLGLPIDAAAVLLLIATPVALLGLLPVPDTTSVVAYLRADPALEFPTTSKYLFRLGKPGLEELDNAHAHEDPAVRAGAITADGLLNRDDRTKLLAHLDDDDDQVLQAALERLWEAARSRPGRARRDEQYLPRAREIAMDGKRGGDVRCAALAVVLQRSGANDDSSVWIDVMFDRTEDSQVRNLAAFAIRSPSPAETLRLRKGLTAGPLWERQWCAYALATSARTRPTESGASALAVAAASADLETVQIAATTLANIGPVARVAAPALRDAAVGHGRQLQSRLAVLVALQKIGLEKSALTPAFLALEKSANPQVRGYVENIRSGARQKR